MIILRIKTPLLKQGDNLADILCATGIIQSGDIIVVSSKALATVEGGTIDLRSLVLSDKAKELSKKCDQDSAFTQAIIDETKRMNGTIERVAPTVLLTSLKPSGMKRGRILCPNAGLDLSNIKEGFAIGWPRDTAKSTRSLWKELQETRKIQRIQRIQKNQGNQKSDKKVSSDSSVSSVSSDSSRSSIAIIISDSTCKPSRLGVTAIALTCAGIDPVRNERGKKDLFGRPLAITNEAIADQLATAGNFLMGNADQCTPAVIIRDHGLPFSDFCGWVDGIEPEEDIFGI
jgi:F420-0:gamma-glutamyl ligase